MAARKKTTKKTAKKKTTKKTAKKKTTKKRGAANPRRAIESAAASLDRARKILRGMRASGVGGPDLEGAIVKVNQADVATLNLASSLGSSRTNRKKKG